MYYGPEKGPLVNKGAKSTDKPLDRSWSGNACSKSDFNGKYKPSWDENALCLLVEITDGVLFDQCGDSLERWWDDDCVEVFVDEDNSGTRWTTKVVQ